MDSIISSLWFDRKNFYNVQRVWKKAQKQDPKITLKMVKDFAQRTAGKQEIYGKVKELPIAITAQYNFEKIQCDLTFLPKTKHNYIGFLSVIDIHSRYLFCEPFRNKSSQSILEVFQKIEREAAELIESKGPPFKIIGLDGGKEFMGAFRDYCDDQGYEMWTSQPGDKRFLSIVERVHKTIKMNSRQGRR